ncbi:molybdenum cofactor biosynthesis protein MoaE [Fusibacter sp. 3D3]|uniref:molybdenum cofactor biosynthesis protein MoaE n=1 Tax=Fusibacter sp. 3D3 TaxID=1048380 RepID=UPI000853DDD0|nr:molybdenum cofactor biosynthesis protein MoaE [Fusibacter sp. 3D3]GAU76033.1 large subunit molybdopterin converting factor [Fusibacter sp. 3D3]
MHNSKVKKEIPSMDQWLKEAKADQNALLEGMFLIHNGVVRKTPKVKVREGVDDGSVVVGMTFNYDAEKVDAAIEATYKMEGIFYVRTWLNEGELDVGDDIMYVLIGGDIRPRVIDALQFLVGKIKNECVVEIEQH